MEFEAIALLIGRILFGAVLLYNGINHFRQTEALTAYTEYKGVPGAQLVVYLSGIVLLAGGLSIILGVFPLVGSLIIVAFLIVAAVLIHNFWAVGEEERENELNHFLKNIGMAGGALALAATATEAWRYSFELGLTF